ncbi:Crp/Fnr family transcriptional regulator [Acidiphilium sp.]|uniref:Crp/Fnr family transcriptional regulator n=1 Tax=Acidiphilium sp. TaxID=527 RepID=UPI003CFD287E
MPLHDLATIDVADAHPPGPAIERTTSTHCGTCAARYIGLCDALSAVDLQELADAACWCSLPKGRILMAEGDRILYFFNISAGHAKLYKDMQDGRRQVIGFVSAGSFLGLGTQDHYGFTTEALDEVQFCRFERRKLRNLFTRFPALELHLLAATCNELVVAQAQMLLLGRKTAIERLATFLLGWVDPSAGGGDPDSIVLPMGRSDTADYLGLTNETVSRSLTLLRKRHLIALNGDQNITIVDPVALRAVGDGVAK